VAAKDQTLASSLYPLHINHVTRARQLLHMWVDACPISQNPAKE